MAPVTAADEENTPSKRRKTQVRFNDEFDMLLAKETVVRNPFDKKFGKKGDVWDAIAQVLDIGVDGRRCRERCTLLADAYARRQRDMEKASGVAESQLPIDEYLAEILEMREEELRNVNNKKLLKTIDADNSEAIRDEAMKGMGERKAKRSSNSLVEYLSKRDASSRVLEERRLDLEERKLALEEKRIDDSRQERLAVLELLKYLSNK